MARNGAVNRVTAGLDAAVKKRARQTLAELKARYPDTGTQLEYRNPWELLVAVELAAQCTDARVNEVTPAFFSRWPGPCELAAAAQADVEAVIKPCGFYRNKARNLVAAARIVCEQYGGQLPASMAELVKLPGVARKTANCVLFAGFGINEGMAVDTHVKRIAYRLGLTDNIDPVRIEKDLTALFPAEEWGDLNHRMVWFGREICKARKPACESCAMRNFCPRRQPPRATGGKDEADDES